MADLLLAGGFVVDGTGAPGRYADVLVREGTIVDIGNGGQPEGIPVRDVSGSVVCPGFVDIHTHSDLTLLSNPEAPSKVHQGVTTEIVGNCGLGVAPLVEGADQHSMRQAVSYLDLDPAIEWTWRDTAGYLATVAAARPSVNVATLVGHLVLHAGVSGFGDRPATTAQIDHMCSLLGDSLDAGAVGLSTGLVYAPLPYVDDEELVSLATVTAARDKIFTWHVRNYDDELLSSVGQALDVARRTGCRTQISHLTAVGKRNWGSVLRALELVDEARSEGLSIGVDIYPYLYGNAPLVQLLPAWAQEGGPDLVSARMREEKIRAAIRTEWAHRPTTWDEITISWAAGDEHADAVGRTVHEIASERGVAGDDVALDLLASLGTGVLIVAGGRNEDDLRAVLEHPATVVASDGLSLDPNGVTGAGVPHPRSYGCFPRYLSRYGGLGPSSLPDAVRRCTGAPAALVGLFDRGLLRPGAAADIVVFSAERLSDRATFADPQMFPEGIELVMVNGEIVVDAGRHTGGRPGIVFATENL